MIISISNFKDVLYWGVIRQRNVMIFYSYFKKYTYNIVNFKYYIILKYPKRRVIGE